MNKKSVLLTAAVVLMAVTAGALHFRKMNQRLGVPAIKATSIPGSVVMQIELPEKVLDFGSTNLEQAEVVTNMLPKDTSYAQRIYTNAEGPWISANIILMGKDRTSIHKPEFCLPGQGLTILSKTNIVIPIADTPQYDLTVARWTVSKTGKNEQGQLVEIRGLYVFWFIADNEQTTSHWKRMGYLLRDMATEGVLQRWAYVSYFTYCMPGQEDTAFERVKRLIAESVPQFQNPPRSAKLSARQ